MLRETALKVNFPDSSPQGGAGVAPVRFKLIRRGPKGAALRPTGPPCLFLRVPFYLRQEAGGRGAALRCLDPSSVPTLLPELAVSPEAAPVVAKTAALSVLPLFLLIVPTQPPLPSGSDSALEPEQQAGGSDRMRKDRRQRPCLAQASDKKE